ncbi:MAG: hypothetical protein ACREJ2_05100 [Planctomycetota bacterium]
MTETAHRDAYLAGRRHGLALAAVAAAAVAFVSLLGAEKAILAIVLALLARRGSSAGSPPQRLSLLALCLSVLYLVLFAVAIVVFRAKLMELIHLLQQLN